MASNKYKRPSSARRNIKQDEFSSFVSLTRLRHVQSLLSEEGEDSDAPNGLLCIAGIDARYNEGMQEFINYLLFNFFEIRKHEIERSGFEEEVVDDVIVLIRKHSVDVYCNPINYMYFLPYIAHWRNLHIHCMMDADYEDEEKAEEFKITSFIAMTNSCSKIAIPFSGTNHKQTFDIMAIEKWPIIQAFALEGMGGGGFFTMKYEVEDISDALQSLYQILDPVVVENLVTEQFPLYERQWESLISNVEVLHGGKMKDLTGGYLLEPLKSYFTHGRINSSAGNRREESKRLPFVLLGTDSKRSMLQNANISGISTLDSITKVGTENSPALHMVCQAVSPKSPICSRRTYFFSNGVIPYPVFSSRGENPIISSKNDIRVLMLVYMACIEAVLAAISTYTETLNKDEAEESGMSILLECWERLAIPLSSNHVTQKQNFEFLLEAFDGNCAVPLSDLKAKLLVKNIGITVYDIPSVEHRGHTLGSVSFGESFMNSYLDIELTNGSRDRDGAFTILTSPVPRIIAWQTTPKENHTLQEIYQHLHDDSIESEVFGEQIINGEQVTLVCEGCQDTFLKDGCLYLYESGMVYIHPHHGVVVVPKAEMTALHFYDGNSPSIVALLIISYQEHIKEFLPVHLRCTYNRFILAIKPKSKAYKQMFSQILPLWKEKDQSPELQLLESDLPEELQSLHNKLQASYNLTTGSPNKLTSMIKAKEIMEGLAEFLPHFEGSSVGSETVPRKHVALISGKEWDEGSFGGNTEELIVTILAGLPGSGKDKLCKVLSRLAKNDSRWAFMKFPVDVEHKFCKEDLQNHLRSTYLNYKSQKTSGSPKMRAVVVTPGFVDTVDVIQSIVGHPDKDLAKRIKIGAVTVCIDPESAYMCDRYTLPKLLDHCAQGWVNNIVFTNFTESQDELLNLVQTTVRAVNSNVALLLAKNAEITRSTDLDLILSESDFNNEDLLRARYLSCPGWWKGTYHTGDVFPKMTEVLLHFSQPLEKVRFSTRLRGLKVAQTKYPFDGNIYHIRGKLRFTESQQLCEIEYITGTGSLSINPASNPTQNNKGTSCYSVVFTGVSLNQARLKDWLRGCAKQRPEKKIYRKRNNLNKVEINRIHKENHLKPLPEGWFYNGSQYVSLAGDKGDFHPDLELFLDHYLEKVNKEVDVYNANIQKQNYEDLFD